MALRLKHRVFVQIAQDTAMKVKRFHPDPDLAEVVYDVFERQMNSDLSIVASGSQSLTFGDVTLVKGLYLELNGPAEVKLNGSADAMVMTPLLTGENAKPVKYFVEADITSVVVENTDSENALTGVYCVWGDPT